jgi:hypothetical protein
VINTKLEFLASKFNTKQPNALLKQFDKKINNLNSELEFHAF